MGLFCAVGAVHWCRGFQARPLAAVHWCWGFQVGLRRALWWCHRLWSLAVRETGVAFAGAVGAARETGVAFAGVNGPVLGG